jgi:DNA-binding XRE family transcriptional regulator
MPHIISAMTIDIQTLGMQIKQCRMQAGISQSALANLAEVSRATINGIENGTIKEIGVNRLNRVLAVSRGLLKSPRIQSQSDRKNLDLSFPYDWSNSAMPDALLIDKVVARGLFEDMAKVAVRFGTEPLRRSVHSFLEEHGAAAASLNRMLANIEKALHASA